MLWDGVVAGIPPSQRQATKVGGKPVENRFFAGEHTNSFYVWEKFMEGAALSGIDAANAILRL